MTQPISAGDLVAFSIHDWEHGPIEFRGRVIRQLSDTHLQVRLETGRLETGMMVAVPAVDCTRVEQDERSAA